MTDQYLDEQNFFRHAKNLTGHTATFGFGNMVSQLVSLFMLPIYTAYFTTADYGVLGLIEVTKTLMMYIVAMGIGSAVNRYFFDKEFESKRPEIVVTGFLAQQMTAIPLCVAIWLMADWVSEVALKSPDQATYGKYLAALVWGELTLMFPNNLLRIHLRSKLYAWLSIGRLVVALLGTIVLVVWLEQGILGALRAALGVTAISIVVQLFIVRHDFKGGWSAEVLSSLLKFGLPYVPHNIAAYLLLTADRYFLAYLIPEDAALHELGLYNVAYKFASGLYLLIGALGQAWAPYIFTMNSLPHQPQIYGRLITFATAAMVLVGTLIAVFVDEAVRLFTQPVFWEATPAVAIIMYAYLCYGFFTLQGPALAITKKSGYIPIISFSSLLTNVVLNMLWIPRWGMMGAAWATLVAYGMMAVMMTYLGCHFYGTPLEWRRLAKLLASSIITVVAASWVVRPVLWEQALLHLGVCLIFPVTLLMLRFVEPNEWERFHRILAKFLD